MTIHPLYSLAASLNKYNSRQSRQFQRKTEMKVRTAQLVLGLVLIFVLTANQLHAQDTQATLSGTVTDSSGKVLSNVKVSVKNLATGQSTEAPTDSAGLYTVPNLAAGDYEVSATVEGVGSGA